MGNGAGAGRFLWDDYFGLFAKAERELESLQASMDSDVMFNFLCSVSHVTEWILRDQRFQGLPPQASADATRLSKDSAVHAIRELCNGAKHLDLDQPKRPPPPVWRTARNWVKRPIASVRRSPRLASHEGETRFLVIVDGQYRDALEVGREVLANWRRLLAQYGLPVPP